MPATWFTSQTTSSPPADPNGLDGNEGEQHYPVSSTMCWTTNDIKVELQCRRRMELGRVSDEVGPALRVTSAEPNLPCGDPVQSFTLLDSAAMTSNLLA